MYFRWTGFWRVTGDFSRISLSLWRLQLTQINSWIKDDCFGHIFAELIISRLLSSQLIPSVLWLDGISTDSRRFLLSRFPRFCAITREFYYLSFRSWRKLWLVWSEKWFKLRNKCSCDEPVDLVSKCEASTLTSCNKWEIINNNVKDTFFFFFFKNCKFKILKNL